MNEDIKKKLIEVFENVGFIRGINSVNHLEDEIGIMAKYVDDYLAVATISQLLEQNKIEITLKADETDNKIEYLLRLLHLKKRGEKYNERV